MNRDSKFESAADAVIHGDAATLGDLLNADADLVHERSAREHHSTLLHYVSANGVEDSRQKTPGNAVDIAKLLLKGGADVNAESNAYGGHSTTLSLTATSCHPEKAGLQLDLLELLIDHGARIDPPGGAKTVNACLRNGRAQAARFLADCGALLDFEGAAGTGRLDLVQTLLPTATEAQLVDGFVWACAYGNMPVAEFLLQQDSGLALKRGNEDQTALHWAAHNGHTDIVRLLLVRRSGVGERRAIPWNPARLVGPRTKQA